MTMSAASRYRICHLFVSSLQGESRLFKELATAEKLFPAETLLSIGLDRGEGKPAGVLQGRYPFERIRLWSARLPKSLPFHLVKYAEWTVRAAARTRGSGAQIIHCHSLPALPAAVLAKVTARGRQILYDAHELETRRANMSPRRQRATRVLERMLMPFVDSIVVVSPSIQRIYQARYPGKQVSLLLNLPQRAHPEPTGEMRKKFRIPPDGKLVIYIGALGPMRGIDLLLQALRSLPDWHCLFLGSGPLESSIKTEAASHPRVHHHPPVPEECVVSVAAEANLSYSVIDCSADSYRFALPNKFFQSLAAGVPVLVNRDNVDMLVVGEETGLVFALDYSMEAIRRFILEFPQRGIARKPQDFSWEKQEHKLIAVYRRILAQGNRSSRREP